MELKEQQYNRAVELLKSSNLTQSEQNEIILKLVNQKADEQPFVAPLFEKGEIKMWQSKLKKLSAFGFTEKEVVLANAIALNLGDKFSSNDFPHQFKAILRILGVDSVWAE